jgi:hypothetical protein
MRALLAAVLLLAAGAAFGDVAPSAHGDPAASRTVDRGFSCRTGLVGGVYSVEARARTGLRRTPSGWEQPAMATIGSSLAGAADFSILNSLAWVTAGVPAPSASVAPAEPGQPLPFLVWGTVAVQLGVCRATSARVPMGTAGLRRATVTPFEDPYDCETPRRVLLRVRATLESPGALTSHRGYLRASRPARSAEVMVRTPAGRPVAYARVTASGKAELLTGRGCVED